MGRWDSFWDRGELCQHDGLLERFQKLSMPSEGIWMKLIGDHKEGLNIGVTDRQRRIVPSI